MLKKILILLVVLVAASAAVLRWLGLPEPLPSSSESARWLSAGSYEVSYFDVTLTDTTRPTQAHGDFAGSEQRKLKTRIWHPQPLHGQHPVVVYSHGFMSRRTGGSYLADHLASHGYIVAAMDYPLSRMGAPGGALIKDVVNQPADISFLLDQLLSWHRERGHQFHGAIDEDRIAALGLSLGGLTSTLVAFHPQMGDPRIDAALSLAGPSFNLAPRFFRHRAIPFMMVASPIDPMVAYRANAADIPQRVPGSVLVTIDRGSHTGFVDVARYFRFMSNPDWLGCQQVLRGLENGSDENWSDELGRVEDGVMPADAPALCAEPLVDAMNPIRQQQLTTIAVHSFLESLFSPNEARRQRAAAFLDRRFAVEVPAVSVQRSTRQNGTEQ